MAWPSPAVIEAAIMTGRPSKRYLSRPASVATGGGFN